MSTTTLEITVANVATAAITHVVDGYVQGYSYAREHGVWEGKHEPMTRVTIHGPVDVAHLSADVTRLAREQGEDSILVRVVNEWGQYVSVVSWPEDSKRTRWERI